jgi:hypothetical protein
MDPASFRAILRWTWVLLAAGWLAGAASPLLAGPPEEAPARVGDPFPDFPGIDQFLTGREAPAPPPPSPATAEVGETCLDNLSLFIGLDGSKQPQDLGINANFGGRLAVNWGVPIWEPWGLGGQLGTSVDYSAGAVHVLDQLQDTRDRWQSLSTAGLFQRAPCGFVWAVGYDFEYERSYGHFDLGQWRGLLGYQLTTNDEAGVRGTLRDRGDSGTILGQTIHLQPITQAEVYWRHTWSTLAETTLWAGVAERHSQIVLLLPSNSEVYSAFTFGAEILVPLNDYLALVGAANFITPNDTGTVDAYLGIALYPGGGARLASHHRFAPLLPVAGNPEFSVDLRR